MRHVDAYLAHRHARLLRARWAGRLVRRLWRAVKAWLERPWARRLAGPMVRQAFR